MKSARNLCFIFLGALVVSSMGCQSSMSVRVEKVVGITSIAARSPIRKQLNNSLENLNAVIGECDEGLRCVADENFVADSPEDNETLDIRSVTDHFNTNHEQSN